MPRTPTRKRAKVKPTYHGIKASVVIAIDPGKQSGYAIFGTGGKLLKYGVINDHQEVSPFAGYDSGLALIESQYMGKNAYSAFTIVERQTEFTIRARDAGFQVVKVSPKTWQTAIGIPPFGGYKRPMIKAMARQFAETVTGEPIGHNMQDAADAICIGETFNRKWRVEIV